jgi:uncharacterized membrane protein
MSRNLLAEKPIKCFNKGMGHQQHARQKQDRAAQAALLVAAASVPNTFQRTLMHRDTTDQGLITGVTMSVNYGIVIALSKVLEDIATQLAGTQNAADDDTVAHQRQRKFALMLDALAVGGGVLAQAKLRQKQDEHDLRSMARTGATWVTYTGIAGLSVGLLQHGVEAFTKPKDAAGNRKITKFPVGVLGGALFATYTEYLRRKSLRGVDAIDSTGAHIQPVKAIALGAGVLGALGGVNYAQRKMADGLSSEMDKVLPGSEDFWWSTGHALAICGTGLGIAALMHKVYRRIEEVATDIEPAYLEPPLSDKVSSGPGSLVSWDSLSVQGRRFVSGVLPLRQITNVMGRQAMAEPIRVFVGLDSAATETERVALAMRELERTGAFKRDLIMLVSPTGTGYVNYVAVEAAECMSEGNMASVAMQYSKRPSPMSLDRVPEGRKQFRMLLHAISERIAELPSRSRPKLMLFGESLGAWTSQDAFVEQGTDGLRFAGVDRALWIGSPYGSKWKTQVLGEPRPDVDPEVVGSFDNIRELRALPGTSRRKLRYVMITHHNDAVALFGAGLLFQKPDWLQEPSKRPPTVSKSQYYTTPGTFLLTLIDMKNAMNVVPGQFEASGHDYRADLAAFIQEAYDFAVTDKQMERIEGMLRQNEVDRAARLGG